MVDVEHVTVFRVHTVIAFSECSHSGRLNGTPESRHFYTMNERDVSKQIDNMVSFITQEAREKASEIMLRAEEDFNIAKLQAVQAERQRLEAEFERKTKQVEIQKRM